MKQKLAEGIIRLRMILLIVILGLTAVCVTTILKTRINYDLTKYLSEDTMTKKALSVMEKEFGSSEQLRLMFADQTERHTSW